MPAGTSQPSRITLQSKERDPQVLPAAYEQRMTDYREINALAKVRGFP